MIRLFVCTCSLLSLISCSSDRNKESDAESNTNYHKIVTQIDTFYKKSSSDLSKLSSYENVGFFFDEGSDLIYQGDTFLLKKDTDYSMFIATRGLKESFVVFRKVSIDKGVVNNVDSINGAFSFHTPKDASAIIIDVSIKYPHLLCIDDKSYDKDNCELLDGIFSKAKYYLKD